MVFENGLGNLLYFPVLRTLQGLRIITAGLCLNRSRKQASRLHNAGKRHLSLGPEGSLLRFGFRWAPLRSRSFRSSQANGLWKIRSKRAWARSFFCDFNKLFQLSLSRFQMDLVVFNLPRNSFLGGRSQIEKST